MRARRPHRRSPSANRPARVFISFSHADSGEKDLLCKHLSSLVEDGLLHLWDDRQLRPGEWPGAIASELDAADVVLLLVSCDFISSSECRAEAHRALRRQRARRCKTIPVILRDCDWSSRPWAKCMCLPTDGHAVRSRRWHSPDEAFTDVARRLRDWLTRKAA
jgi:hypothetical protein